MNSIDTIVPEIVNRAKGSNRELGMRHYHLFCARQDRVLTEEELNRICFCEMEAQRKSGKLKEQPLPTGSQTKYEKKERWRVECKNHATEEWREDLSVFISEVGLQMSENEEHWYRYVTTGEMMGTVKQYLERSILEGKDG